MKRGIRKLFGLGLFADVGVERDIRGGQVDVIIRVRERPRIAKIEFTGQRKRETEDLEKRLILRVGEPHSPTLVQTQVDSLLRYYREEGFARARIDAVADTLDSGGIALRFVIQEGERVKITRIQLVGATAFKEKKLRKQMKTKTKSLFGGGEVKDENFAEDREKLEAYYRNNGYRDARVVGHDLGGREVESADSGRDPRRGRALPVRARRVDRQPRGGDRRARAGLEAEAGAHPLRPVAHRWRPGRRLRRVRREGLPLSPDRSARNQSAIRSSMSRSPSPRAPRPTSGS